MGSQIQYPYTTGILSCSDVSVSVRLLWHSLGIVLSVCHNTHHSIGLLLDWNSDGDKFGEERNAKSWLKRAGFIPLPVLCVP
jgi:hypothetical protein